MSSAARWGTLANVRSRTGRGICCRRNRVGRVRAWPDDFEIDVGRWRATAARPASDQRLLTLTVAPDPSRRRVGASESSDPHARARPSPVAPRACVHSAEITTATLRAPRRVERHGSEPPCPVVGSRDFPLQPGTTCTALRTYAPPSPRSVTLCVAGSKPHEKQPPGSGPTTMDTRTLRPSAVMSYA